MSVMVAERKYVLTKIAPGDYLLPSNDGKTLWRISRYEDGPTAGLDIPRDREFWGAWKFTGPGTQLDVEDVEDWGRWEQWYSAYDKRSEAIDAALSL